MNNEIPQIVKDQAEAMLESMKFNMEVYGPEEGLVQILIDHLAIVSNLREQFFGPEKIGLQTTSPSDMMMIYLRDKYL